MTTNERRNRSLGAKLAAALNAAGFTCQSPDGWGDSIYAKIETADGDSFKLRISDHAQPIGGGWSESKGERHGEADIAIEIDTGPGAGLAWAGNGEIVRVPHARVSFSEDVPEEISVVAEPIVAAFAVEIERRSESAKRAAATRKANKSAKFRAGLIPWHQAVCDAMAGTPDVIVVREATAPEGDPGWPRPEVAAAEPNRKLRLRTAQAAIDAVVARLMAQRKGK